jgi:Fe-S cluster assembly scaffold protein SufB
VERIAVRNPRRRERLGHRAYRQGDTSARGATFRTHTSATLGFARVIEIEEADTAPVYDIAIDGPHNFVAEGIVVHNSEVVYHRNRADLEGLGVLFCDMDTALREYPDIVRKHFGTVVPPGDNKYAALNSAVWSGGSFIYVPPGVHLDQPLQAYFRINAENMGQFERTMIIVDEGAFCHYVEGCSAPTYSSDSLHAAVVEIIIKDGGRCRYSTIQNWSTNVFNLVTKRAVAHRNATMEWVDGNLGCIAEGSRVTTRSGVKPIEWVVPGEEVLSFDEEAGEFCFRLVTAKRYSGRQAVREVRTGIRSLRVTDNHPFYSYEYDPSRARKSGRYRLAYRRADSLEQAIVPRDGIGYDHPHLHEVGLSLWGPSRHGLTAVLERPQTLAAEDEAATLLDSVEIRRVEVGEPGEAVPTWDIEVEGTGNFVCEGFIVHNSRLSMKYPAVWLVGEGAHGEVLSIAFAGKGQHQDTGAKIVHAAPHTTSLITSKSISKDGGRAGYRGLLRVEEGAHHVKSFVRCDALILDPQSRSDTYPYMEIEEADASIGHEATVSKVGDDQLFYLMTRGLSQAEATAMIVAGFIEPIVRELPMEYAVELNRLIELQMEGSVG